MHLTSMILISYLVTHSLTAESHAVYSSGIPGSAASWVKGSRASKNQIIYMDFTLAASEAKLKSAAQALQNISDPTSQHFGQHWTAGQVMRHFVPSQDSVQEVLTWLSASGVPQSTLRTSLNRGHIFFNATVEQAEKLLGTQYYQYSNGQATVVGAEAYSLPLYISKHVDYVLPALMLSRPSTKRQAQRAAVSMKSRLKRSNISTAIEVDCFKYVTPQCIRQLYNFPETRNGSSHPNNSFGIYESAWASYLPTDLDDFFTDFQPTLVGARPSLLSVDGGFLQDIVKGDAFNLESDLDYQYSMSLAYPLPVTDIQVGDMYQLGDLNLMLAGFDQYYCKVGLDPAIDPVYPDTGSAAAGGYNASDCGSYQPPLVISISDAFNEAWYPKQYLERECLEYLKLGLQGVTVIAATGDWGPADQVQMCIDPETGAANVSKGHFSSNFPASCPWVTAVGGTQLLPTNQTWMQGSKYFPPETALNQFVGNSTSIVSSGGGFSNIFSTPFYQSAETEAYLTKLERQPHLTNLSSSGYFNPCGRGYPDISALAVGYLVFVNGSLHTVLGTSASTPVFASMIAKINDARLYRGKGPVGFLNPVIYAYRHEVMRDIELGSNTGCGIVEAFPATKGWDAVTGLGSPMFEKLLDLYLRLS